MRFEPIACSTMFAPRRSCSVARHERGPCCTHGFSVRWPHGCRTRRRCYLHIATVVLQLFVQWQAMSSSLGKTTDKVVSHIYGDFFGMTSVSLEMSLPAIDLAWWLDFSPTVVLSGISVHLGSLVPGDVALVLSCKVTYVFGIAFLLLEQSMALVETVLVSSTLKTTPVKLKDEAKV